MYVGMEWNGIEWNGMHVCMYEYVCMIMYV